ncbi:MAG: hypothetical protein MK212_03410 [Saprospiraceae bacterium]|nr:hypothetical protein [Saprospiraceae bacterium]
MHALIRLFTAPSVFICTLFCLTITSSSQAQLSKEDCEYLLKDAQLNYDMGLLDDVLTSDLINCLESSEKKLLSKQDKIAAYRLYTESFLFMNEIDSANHQYEKLLGYNPLHRVTPNDKTASYDFIYLSNTYRKKPIFSVYGKMGVNYSRLQVFQYYSLDNTNDLTKNYNTNRPTIGINGGLGFEIPLFEMKKPFPLDIELVVEANLANRAYSHRDSLYMNTTSTDARFDNSDSEISTALSDPLLYATTTFRESQMWIDAPIMLKANWRGKKQKETVNNVIPYIYVGVDNSFLLDANLVKIRRTTEQEVSLDGGNQTQEKQKHRVFFLDKKGAAEQGRSSLRSFYNFSAVAGAGVKLRLERNYFFMDLRYNHFFLNNVNRENRYSDNELLYRFAYVDSDFRMSNLAFTLGFAKSFYTPSKKRKYNNVILQKRLDKMIKRRKVQASNTPDKELKDQMNRNIRDLERVKESSLNRVKSGLNKNKQELDKARHILKGGPDVPKVKITGPSIQID